MPVRVSYKKQFLVMIMLLVVFFAVLEGVLRVYDFYNPRCDLMKNPLSENYDYELKKQICDMWKNHLVYIDPVTGISQNVPNQQFPSMNMNSHGFRGAEILKEKPDETFRIFIVGGSTTFAIRAPSDEHTIPGHLQQIFDNLSLNKRIEVINAGIDGITSVDELQLVKTKLVDFEPDLIIIYDAHNDLANVPPKMKAKYEDDLFTQIWKKHLQFYETPFIFGGMLDRGENILQRLSYNASIDEKISLWKENLISICELGIQKDFNTITILQPMLGTGNKTLTEHEKENFENKFRARILPDYELFANEINELENYCTITADFRNVFDDMKEGLYFDGVHVTSDGNKRVAEKISELATLLIE